MSAILAARRAVGMVLTAQNINAKVKALATRTGAQAQPLSLNGGAIDLWSKAMTDLLQPGIGFQVGALAEATQRLQSQNFSRIEGLPLYVYFRSSTGDDSKAYDEAALYDAAVLYCLDAFPPNGIEQLFMGWTPDAGVVLCEPAGFELLTIEAASGAKQLGFRAKYKLKVDDLRS